jgi:hypothetical protein
METEKPHDVGGCRTTCGAFWSRNSKNFDAECNLSSGKNQAHAGEVGKRFFSSLQVFSNSRKQRVKLRKLGF